MNQSLAHSIDKSAPAHIARLGNSLTVEQVSVNGFIYITMFAGSDRMMMVYGEPAELKYSENDGADPLIWLGRASFQVSRAELAAFRREFYFAARKGA